VLRKQRCAVIKRGTGLGVFQQSSQHTISGIIGKMTPLLRGQPCL
jgi:hypothetical protein